ncbi:MAG TPA: cation diffusion facilitator family transporter [Acidimicrobiales bacterium]|nr:cation diffusion facilitator family transporter [Acidimicrobiales bacterium]
MGHSHVHDHVSGDGRGRAHGHAHVPGAGARAGARHKRRLLAALVVLGVVMVAEVVAAFVANSLALLSDAGHMLTDVAGLGMALAAIHVADRARSGGQRTFGLYRLEILAALANAILLFGVALYVLIEAVRRWGDPPDVLVGPMLAVAALGLAANVVAFALLRPGAAESLNVRGAYLEVLADLVGSVGVIGAAVVIGITGWAWVDPVVGVAIGAFILPRTWRLAGQALRILVQAAPPGFDLAGLEAQLRALDGVVDVHDLHVWTLTSDMEVASVHLMVCDGTDTHAVLDRARDIMRSGHGIDHATLQVEPDTHVGCDELAW